MSGCAAIGLSKTDKAVPTNGCEWVDSLDPPDLVIDALKELQNNVDSSQEKRLVRVFRERLAVHEKNYSENCNAP